MNIGTGWSRPFTWYNRVGIITCWLSHSQTIGKWPIWKSIFSNLVDYIVPKSTEVHSLYVSGGRLPSSSAGGCEAVKRLPIEKTYTSKLLSIHIFIPCFLEVLQQQLKCSPFLRNCTDGQSVPGCEPSCCEDGGMHHKWATSVPHHGVCTNGWPLQLYVSMEANGEYSSILLAYIYKAIKMSIT